MRSIALVALVLAAAPASAEHTAAETRGAPPPGQESGRVDDPDDEGALLLVGRGLLFVPRVAFEVVSAPVRGTAWAYDRFQLRERWYRWFFNDDRTIGLYPLLAYDAEYGVSAGARFVARDLFGAREHFSATAAAGGAYSALVRGALRTGDRFDSFELELAAEYERRPRDRFYGIGNADESTLEMAQPLLPIDPLTSDVAVESRYRQDRARARATIAIPLVSALSLRTAGALARLEYGSGVSGTPVEDVYMTDDLVGWDGVRLGYGELELVWDSRRSYSPWEILPIATTGSLASIYGGRVAVEDGAGFWRVGADAQYLARISDGPRVIATRAHVEAVSGSIDEVPFDELPKLGGRYLLRGYATDRFRDRAAGLATVEYRWDLSKYLLAHLFVDAGRVASSADNLADGSLRVGYGLGIDAYTERSFVLRTSFETSIDGGFFFNIVFDPAFEIDPRVKRR